MQGLGSIKSLAKKVFDGQRYPMKGPRTYARAHGNHGESLDLLSHYEIVWATIWAKRLSVTCTPRLRFKFCA